MASRKDYIAAAEVIKTVIEMAWREPAGQIAAAAVARGLAENYRADNPRFDFDRFYAACGLDRMGDPIHPL